MDLNLRRLAAATAVAGTVIVGGAGWAAAQDDPSTSDDPGVTSEEPGTHDRGVPGDSGSTQGRQSDCHGDAHASERSGQPGGLGRQDRSGGSSGSGGTADGESAEASVFAA
jgi:hypothetical protein